MKDTQDQNNEPQSALLPDGFVLHKLRPLWIAKGSRISAWFDADGNVKDAEIINAHQQSRSVKQGTPVWAYAEREGKRFAQTLKPKA